MIELILGIVVLIFISLFVLNEFDSKKTGAIGRVINENHKEVTGKLDTIERKIK